MSTIWLQEDSQFSRISFTPLHICIYKSVSSYDSFIASAISSALFISVKRPVSLLVIVVTKAGTLVAIIGLSKLNTVCVIPHYEEE